MRWAHQRASPHTSSAGESPFLLTRRDAIPVKLLPVAAQAKVFEHGPAFEFGLALEIGPVLDTNLEPALEVDQFGTKPDVEALDSAHLDPDQVGNGARFQLDRGGVKVLPEHFGGLGRGRAARA